MRRLGSLLVLIALGAPAYAEEMQVSLRDCLERALVGALEIREGRHLPRIAATGIVEAESEFDHLLSFRTGAGRSRTPSVTVFDDMTVESQFSAELGVSQRLTTGGIYTFGFSTRGLDTDSRFYSSERFWTSELSLNLTQPLLRGGGLTYNEARTRLAESDFRRARQAHREIVNATLAGVERAYWRLVGLREDLLVKRHSQGVAEELERISRRRLDAGAGTKVDLVQAQAGVAERVKQVILAEARVENAEDLLRSFVFPFPDDPGREIGLVPTDDVKLEPPEQKRDFTERIQTAFDMRPDVLAAREDLESSGIRVVQAENELLPRLDFFGNFGLSGVDQIFADSTRDIMRGDFPAYEVGLYFELPIGNRAARARHRRALLQKSRTIAGFESLENRVIVEVRTAVRNLETARREILATREATTAAQAQFEAEVDRVRAEQSTNYQLLLTEFDLSSARSQELAANVAYRIAVVDLEEATGTYLEARGLLVEPEEPEFSERTGE